MVERALTVRQTKKLASTAAADFSRIRNANLDRLQLIGLWQFLIAWIAK
jgi:hypothetical protein